MFVVTVWDILCLIVLGLIALCILAGLIIMAVHKISTKIKSKMYSKKHKEINKYDE